VSEPTTVNALLEGIYDNEPVSGLTHGFYRYPARFSPAFVRAVIEEFTKPGDTVFDPFMGSGTTLVEASAMGRRAAGTDVSSLGVFLAKAKTSKPTQTDISAVNDWIEKFVHNCNLKSSTCEPIGDEHRKWDQPAYERNLRARPTWAIRKLLFLARNQIVVLPTVHQRRLARCILLKTAQWALDCRKAIPTARQFREQMRRDAWEILEGIRDYMAAASAAANRYGLKELRPMCLLRSAVGIEEDPRIEKFLPPKLVLTSPPYPGVHVLYHRWQVQGRRETPAPFWITGTKDGCGASYYTFGDRHRPGLSTYYQTATGAFRSISQIADSQTVLVQMIAFSEPSWQLPRYLRVMEESGFVETRISSIETTSGDGRIWRSVPNRKWYADQRGPTSSSKEVVMFHRLASSK
jgi:hypothetical protein